MGLVLIALNVVHLPLQQQLAAKIQSVFVDGTTMIYNGMS